jgi:phosphoribosylaminoimidazolecarboxamide formyltransferase/IMP cyclohydrolase
VYDKTGVVEFAQSLSDLGWSLISSGGTARAIADAGIQVTDVADVTGVPAILGHRVVTLHPKVHGGILADPTDAEHVADMNEYGITPFDLVVGNLYPFGQSPDDFEHGSGGAVEMIDIGGPAMVRAAAKNHAHVAVVVDPKNYDPVIDELRADGALSETTRRRLARAAFAHTAAYDAAIVTWFDDTDPDLADESLTVEEVDTAGALPASIHLALSNVQSLRYGENPHQEGARYRQAGATSWWDSMTQHGGKALSYLNLYDTEAAWRLVHRFDDPACVVV